MKEFAVTITIPAFADMLVEAETKEAAIKQIKKQLEDGVEVDFELEFGDPEEMDFFAAPIVNTPPHPALKDYTVTLEAKAYQEVPVKAVSEAAAVQLVYQMYNRTDAIDFNDSHVVEIKSGIKSDVTDEDDETMVELVTEAVRAIRDCDLTDEELGREIHKMILQYFD